MTATEIETRLQEAPMGDTATIHEMLCELTELVRQQGQEIKRLKAAQAKPSKPAPVLVEHDYASWR